ncbi:MAG: hypothetical protein U0640_10770 [Phycisphaerales bacterium]
MSFSAHKRDSLDESMPIAHRMSHLRSCAVLVAEKYNVPRSEVVNRIKSSGGVNIEEPQSNSDIQRVIEVLTLMKTSGLETIATHDRPL